MAEREIIHVLKKSDIVNRPLPSSLKYGEPIINSADGIMYFSGVTSSTDEWTPAGTGTTANFFEVGSNLYDLRLRNQITQYEGISGGGLTGKFLSGTTSGFVLADVSDISGSDTYVTGGTINYVNEDGTITFTRSNGDTFTVTNITDIQTTGGTVSYVDEAGTATFTQNDGTTFQVAGFTDIQTTGSTLIGDTIYFDNQDSLSAYTADLSALVSSLTLTDGNGTFVTGDTAVNLGGILTDNIVFSGASKNIDFGTADSKLTFFRVDSIQGLQSYSAGSSINTITDNPGGRVISTTGPAHIGTWEIHPGTVYGAVSGATGEVGALGIQVNGDDKYAEVNINNNGLLTSLTAATTTLNYDNNSLVIGTGSTVFTDTTAANAGIEYAADYTTGFTNESLITKRYVDAAVTGITPTDTYVTGFTYDNANNITIAQNEGEADLTINLTTFTGVTISTLDANAVVYTDGSGTLTTETAFAYNAATDTMTVGNVNVQNGTGDTATFGQGGVTIGSSGIGDLTVQGDLTVLGDTTTVSTSELLIEDPTITLNYSTGTTNPTSLGSGIEIQDGDGAGTDLYLKVEELNTAYAAEYPATTGAGNRAFYTSLNDIVIRQATDTTSPSVGQVGKRVLAEDDILDGGTY